MHPLDLHERRRIKAASRALDLLPANAPASALFDAIRLCVPVSAGLFSVIRPGTDDALVSQPVHLSPELFDSWLRMPPLLLEATLAPVVASSPGKLLRDSETFLGAQREQLEVLHELDGAGLGEGAGYKVLERSIPWYGTEQVMLALLMERGERVPARAQVMLSNLYEQLQAAVLRIALPFVAHQPFHEQIVAEQALGYICISPGGRVIEANRRARHLVERYGHLAGIHALRGAVEAFALRVREKARNGQPLQLRIDSPPAVLQVDVHRLAKETYVVPEDAILLHMREVLAPPVVAATVPALERLTERERQLALLLARSNGSQKEIAADLQISSGTMRTHTQNVYVKLGVKSRAQLTVLLNP
jgi:DNA-binding CsgD family transcriptional regulator